MTEQSQLGPSYDGTVVLDIGGDVGALIILTGADRHLVEIEISRADGERALPPGSEVAQPHDQPPDHSHDHSHGDGPPHSHSHSHSHGHGAPPARTHVAVRERRGPNGVRYAAIYPALNAGEYTVWGSDGQVADAVEVVGGEVAQLDWR
jgi:hypothetical protein